MNHKFLIINPINFISHLELIQALADFSQNQFLQACLNITLKKILIIRFPFVLFFHVKLKMID